MQRLLPHPATPPPPPLTEDDDLDVGVVGAELVGDGDAVERGILALARRVRQRRLVVGCDDVDVIRRLDLLTRKARTEMLNTAH